MKRVKFGRALRMVTFAVLSAVAAYAVDGVTLIDQKSALSGKVTAGDTAGFPITISQPGSYRLSSNLTLPDAMTDGINVLVDDVTIDLNGFAIIGPNTCTPNPVRCTYSGGGQIGIEAIGPVNTPSPANVRIINGMVRGMSGHGIRMLGDNTSVENVTSMMNGGPGIVVGDGMVLNSVARLNASGAAMIGTIVKNSISSHNVFGIAVRPGGVAIGNVANNNGATGISATNATLMGNTANNNGTNGLDVVCPASVTGNTTNLNQQTNIRVTGVCTLADNAQ